MTINKVKAEIRKLKKINDEVTLTGVYPLLIELAFDKTIKVFNQETFKYYLSVGPYEIIGCMLTGTATVKLFEEKKHKRKKSTVKSTKSDAQERKNLKTIKNKKVNKLSLKNSVENKEETFYFTFEKNHLYKDKIQPVRAASISDAKNKLLLRFGPFWDNCYSEVQFKTQEINHEILQLIV